jgi:hypothetical protein
LECDISGQLFDARTSNDWAEEAGKTLRLEILIAAIAVLAAAAAA